MTLPRPYWTVAIRDNGEPLVEIPLQDFSAANRHDYQKLGAPYHATSPYAVRQGILDGLYQAQACLQLQHPDWRLYIFDAYRPLAVQQFMANHAYQSLVEERKLDADHLNTQDRDHLWDEVYAIWAPPNENPLTPPPHSTGAAVDLTIFDTRTHACIDMGSPIDELSERSQPHYYDQLIAQNQLNATALDQAKRAANHRATLLAAMEAGGFKRHPGEWWHFCLGDQMWVWLSQADNSEIQEAYYGRYDRVGKAMISSEID